MKFLSKCIYFTIVLLFVFLMLERDIYAENDTFNEKSEKKIKEVKAEWQYNPFKKVEGENKLTGWLDPNSYLMRFWIGDVVSKRANLADPNWNIDNGVTFFSATAVADLNPIAFRIDDWMFRIGVSYLVDLQFIVYKKGTEPLYGLNGSVMMSDYMRVNLHVDAIYKNKLKIRVTPLYHICSHASGDYMGDPSFSDIYKSKVSDLAIEGMNIEAFYNWNYFTFYGGLNFIYRGIDKAPYATIFGANIGTDVRIPIWGEINFITGFYFALNYDVIREYNVRTGDMLSEKEQLNPAIVVGAGFEIYNYILGVKYSRMQSRHPLSYTTIDEYWGFEVAIYF